MESRLAGLRKRVAREAALLLYSGQEKEYKQAKKRAVDTLGVRVLPSNLEVAEELNQLAEESEGPLREKLLIRMRKEALELMGVLKDFYPRLVGSVWRGTAHRGSDIDIVTFSSDAEAVFSQLRRSGFRVLRTEWQSVTKHGRKESSFHIYLVLSSGDEAEIVVRSLERMGLVEKCEIYGDVVTGLSYSELQKVLRENPLQKFVPT